jgi:hypothetical protein
MEYPMSEIMRYLQCKEWTLQDLEMHITYNNSWNQGILAIVNVSNVCNVTQAMLNRNCQIANIEINSNALKKYLNDTLNASYNFFLP